MGVLPGQNLVTKPLSKQKQCQSTEVLLRCPRDNKNQIPFQMEARGQGPQLHGVRVQEVSQTTLCQWGFAF